MLKQILLLTKLILLTSVLHSQTVSHIEYGYDNAGNRITRTVIYLRDAPKTSGESVSQNNSDNEENIAINTISDIDIKIFPNPVESNLTVELNNYHNERLSVHVFDMGGKKIFEDEHYDNRFKIPFNNLKPGAYLMRIIVNGNSNNEYKEFKIIKE